MIRPAPHIAGMAAYALADMQPPDGKPLVSLAQNESLRPPSPAARVAAMRALDHGEHYPDPDWTALRHAIAECHDIEPEGILCGSGSLDLIGAIARVYAGSGRAALAPAHAYPFFRTATEMAGARFDTAPERDLTVDTEALLAAVRPDTSVVFVANPGNPTGTRIGKDALRELRAGLRDDILLVIDEAYGEFADHLDARCFDMVSSGATVVLRTMSKAYGMAGHRVGWGLFPVPVAQEIRKVVNPNNISAASQAAAVAAIRDHDYMQETCALTAAGRKAAWERLRDAGFEVVEGHTNFLLLDCGDGESARAMDHALRAQGIFLRQQAGAGLPQMLRLTIGPEGAMEKALTLIERLAQGNRR
ncbi:pyridoxal phosphate-dependent aminotransferase [Lutimaribacter marinistellae]|uniref:Pyridoxal phosphate-dependent aminotransferase n=1 Tax=Lutimaribacter marinistellae TaxID=1820329 RepID=A0ABV7T970_9RHOB